MTALEILGRLWAVYSETPFSAFSLRRNLDLRPQELTQANRMLADLSASNQIVHGYRVHRVASSVYKLIKVSSSQKDEAPGSDQKEADKVPPVHRKRSRPGAI